MIKSHQMPSPGEVSVFEAAYGIPVQVEYWLIQESETAFFDSTFSVDLVLPASSKLAVFLTLHPWFCQHVVFVWKEGGKTINLLLDSFNYVTSGKDTVVIAGVKAKPISTLLACEIIEESRQTMESYDGTKATELKEKHDERRKQYFQ